MFEIAKAHKCNKIALGHHQDDILETLLMNLTHQGAFGTMPPRLRMDKFESGSSRSDMKELLRSLEAINPEARYSLWGSMTNIQEDYLPRKIR